jgi:hypothetical protein
VSQNLFREPANKLSQGDIVVAPHLRINEALDAEVGERVEISATGRASLGVVINYDCEIDKPWSETLIVCPIIPLEQIGINQRTNAKANRLAHLFFMHRYQELWPDSVAVLNQQTTFDKKLIDPAKRLATLTVEGRQAFYGQFVRWLSRWELRELTCPNCGVEFDPTISLPIRNPDEP